MCDSIDIGYGSSLNEGIKILKGFGSGTGVGYSEKEETYLLLKEKLKKEYGSPKRINEDGKDLTLEFEEIGIKLIPEVLGIDFSYSKGEKLPKEISRLITKLQKLNE